MALNFVQTIGEIISGGSPITKAAGAVADFVGGLFKGKKGDDGKTNDNGGGSKKDDGNAVDFVDDKRNTTTQDQGSRADTSQDGKNSASGAQSSIMAVNTSTEANIEQASNATSQNSVSQVLTAQSDAYANSEQSNVLGSTGGSVTVAPVMSVNLSDSYETTADSDYFDDDHSSHDISWLAIAALAAAGAFIAYRMTSQEDAQDD